MSINNNFTYSNTAKILTHLKNPNAQTGTVLIEIPADVGRAYSGYKRGGIIEGAEKFRKEVMSAIVWLFGIPLFNAIGNFTCEKLLKLPMDIDYSNSKDGEDAIRNTIEYLANKSNPKNFDTSEIDKYLGKFDIKNIDKTVKNIKIAKQAISISALVINCVLMGIALPKINQAITRKKLQKEQQEKYSPQFDSMKEFQEKTKKENQEISFKGLKESLYEKADWATYGINNNNRFRLISTDLPMIIGRCATARNKYEALEIAIMDSAAILFYNYTQGWTQDILRKLKGVPNVNAKVAESLLRANEASLYSAIECANNTNEVFSLKNLFDKEIIDEIYKQGTNNKYGKINRFVKFEELSEIDTSVKNLLKKLKPALENNKVNKDKMAEIIKKINIKNSRYYALGTIVSVLGLGILIPKIAYAITKKITGKDGFVGIQQENKKNVNNC